MAENFNKGGQQGCFYDLGHWGGYFHTYDRLILGENSEGRRVDLFLPRNYEVSQERYPVLYLNDGHTAFFPGGPYHKSWRVPEILTRLYLGNQIRRLIVVAVSPLDRDYEYTHAPVWGCRWGGLKDYSAYVAGSLKGFIDANYRTLAGPESNVILGAGHGGLAAFHTATHYPDAFRGVAALSPSFWVGLDSSMDFSLFNVSESVWGNVESSVLMYTAYKALQDPYKKPKIYLDWGLIRDGGIHNSFMEERATNRGREMRDVLLRNFSYSEGYNLFTVEDPLGSHSEESWSGRLDNILRIFFSY